MPSTSWAVCSGLQVVFATFTSSAGKASAEAARRDKTRYFMVSFFRDIDVKIAKKVSILHGIRLS